MGMNRNCTNENIKVLCKEHIVCSVCKEHATFKVVKISDKIFPNPKIEVVVRCSHCQRHKSDEHDVLLKNYALTIKCTFKKNEDLSRRIYLNSGSLVKIYGMNKMLIYEFMSDDASVDTLETLLLRAMDQIKELIDEKTRDTAIDYSEAVKKLDSMRNKCELMMEIIDESGYSRVYPVGVTKLANKG